MDFSIDFSHIKQLQQLQATRHTQQASAGIFGVRHWDWGVGSGSLRSLSEGERLWCIFVIQTIGGMGVLMMTPVQLLCNGEIEPMSPKNYMIFLGPIYQSECIHETE
jgi:hypothetical protein